MLIGNTISKFGVLIKYWQIPFCVVYNPRVIIQYFLGETHQPPTIASFHVKSEILRNIACRSVGKADKRFV